MDIAKIIEEVLNLIINNYAGILLFLAAGGGLSILLELFKRMRNWERSSWIQFVLLVMTSISIIADYILTNNHQFVSYFGTFAPALFTAATFMRYVTTKPLFKLTERLLEDWLKPYKLGKVELQQQNAKLKEIRSSQTSVTVAPQVAAVTPQPTEQTFSDVN